MKARISFLLPILWVQGFLVSPDLMKFPLLVAHFLEHQASDEKLDLGTFIVLHYADSEHQTEDHSNHENLPFHHHHGAAVDHSPAKVLATDPPRQVSFPALTALSAITLPVDGDLLSGHYSALRRPPKALA